MLWV